MSRIKTLFSITYSNKVQIEVSALFDNVEDYVETVEQIEAYINRPDLFDFSVIRLTPFNDDINGEFIATDILIKLEGILVLKAVCTEIEYKEPLL